MSVSAHFYHALIDSGAVEEQHFDDIEMAMYSGIVQWSEPVPDGVMLLLGMHAAAARACGWLEATHIKHCALMQDKWSPPANSSCRKQNSFVTNTWPKRAAKCNAVRPITHTA